MALKINISSKMVSKPFTFTAICKDLENTISKAVATLASSPSGTRNFAIIAKGDKVYLAAMGTDTFVVLLIPNAAPESSGVFCFEAERLIGVIKNRSSMNFEFTANQECAFSLVKGKYSGKFVTLPVTDDLVSLFNETFSATTEATSSAIFSPQTLELLKEGLVMTAVKDVFNSNALLSYITFTKKRLTVSTFDDHHFGYFDAPSDYKGKPFKIATPITHFQLVDRVANGYVSSGDSDYELSAQQETLRVVSDSFILVLPLIQVDEKHFETIPGFLEDLGKPSFHCSIDLVQLSKVVENLFTLHEVNTTFDFSFKGGNQLKLTYSSPRGSASDSLQVDPGKSKAITAQVSPPVFKDSITLAKTLKDPELVIEAERCILMRAVTKSGATATFVCSLV